MSWSNLVRNCKVWLVKYSLVWCGWDCFGRLVWLSLALNTTWVVVGVLNEKNACWDLQLPDAKPRVNHNIFLLDWYLLSEAVQLYQLSRDYSNNKVVLSSQLTTPDQLQCPGPPLSQSHSYYYYYLPSSLFPFFNRSRFFTVRGKALSFCGTEYLPFSVYCLQTAGK